LFPWLLEASLSLALTCKRYAHRATLARRGRSARRARLKLLEQSVQVVAVVEHLTVPAPLDWEYALYFCTTEIHGPIAERLKGG